MNSKRDGANLYSNFAAYYDALTPNVNYDSRADYFDSIIKKNNKSTGLAENPKPLLLDLACGTGELSLRFSQKGYDVTGVDISPEMLSQAMNKSADYNERVLFLCQPMEKLDLYGTMDAVVCALDSINHLTREAVKSAFNRLSLFVSPGGVFVFDVNTEYKHKEILKDNCFVYETKDILCVWRNNLLRDNKTVEIMLDFFEYEHSSLYSRSSEVFKEYIHDEDFLREILADSGFTVLNVYEGDTYSAPSAEAQRLVFVAQKQ